MKTIYDHMLKTNIMQNDVGRVCVYREIDHSHGRAAAKAYVRYIAKRFTVAPESPRSNVQANSHHDPQEKGVDYRLDQRRWWVWCVLGSAMLLLAGCPSLNNQPTGDPNVSASDPNIKPPEFLAVDVKIEPRTGPIQPDQGSISIKSANVTRSISKNNRIRLIVTAGDSEFGIARLGLATREGADGKGAIMQQNLQFTCNVGGGPLVGILQLATMVTTPAMPSFLSPSKLGTAEVVIDPVGETAGSCNRGTRTLSGWIRVEAINGKDKSTSSGTFFFDFVP